MRVLVAGATGVVGRALVPLLTSVGHKVVGLSRTAGRMETLRRTGAEAVVADVLDRDAVHRAVREAAPDAVVNMLTAIPAAVDPRRLARDFELTNRLRAEGTRNLYEAAESVGVARIVAQGLAYAYDPAGGKTRHLQALANEDAPLWLRPPRQFVPVLGALRELEQRTVDAGGSVLRFGHLYGPGSSYAADGSFVSQVRAGKVPLVGGGTAVFSFTHAHDAATAVVAALDRPVNGALNIVDDDPAPMHQWLPHLAHTLDAPRPRTAPAALARLAVGGWGVAFMTRLRGADNARAKLSLNWRPRYASWQEGFALELNGTAAPAA